MKKGDTVRVRGGVYQYLGCIGVIKRKSFDPTADWLVYLMKPMREEVFRETDLEPFEDPALQIGDYVEIVSASDYHGRRGIIVGPADPQDSCFDWKIAFDTPKVRNSARNYDFEFGAEELKFLERRK